MNFMMKDLGKKIKAFRQIQRKLKRRRLESELLELKSRSTIELHRKAQLPPAPLNKKIQKDRRRKTLARPDNLRKLLPLASKVAGYLGDAREFLKWRLINHQVYDILSNSFVWQGVLQNIDPQLLREVNPNFMEVSLIKSITMLDDYVREGLREFGRYSATAKSLMLEGNYDRSIKYFLQPVLIVKDLETLEQSSCIFKHFLPKVSRYAILKTTFSHYLDTASTYLALKNPTKTIGFAQESLKYYNKLKELFNDSPQFRDDFKSKFRRVKRIIREGLNLLNNIHFIHYSEQEYPGLRRGSLLVATSGIGDDIFASSKILITRFERNGGCEGIILNKQLDDQAAGALSIGGPCDMDRLFYLHDNPNVRGAIRVKEGLYFGGEIEDVFSSDGYLVKQYLGYCSWMPGQLEGELFNNDWVLRNDLSAIDILFGNLNSI
jgi:putative transcriptional regulator